MNAQEHREFSAEVEQAVGESLPPDVARMIARLEELEDSPAWRYLCDLSSARLGVMAQELTRLDPGNMSAIVALRERAYLEEQFPAQVQRAIQEFTEPYTARATAALVGKKRTEARGRRREAEAL